MSTCRLLLGSAVVLLAAAALALMASPASAVIYKDGDWVVSGVEQYENETIIINSTAPNNGNLIVTASGTLTIDNCTVYFPFNRTFDHGGVLTVRNTTLNGPNWFFFIHGPALIYDTNIINATHRQSGGFSGTYISDNDVHFHNVEWAALGSRPSAYRSAPIHVRVVMDFQDVRLLGGVELYYELSPISGSAIIDVSNITTNGYTSMNYQTTPISVTPVTHTGTVLYQIHDLNLTDPLDGIDLRQSSASTVYQLYNITFNGIQSTGLEIGDTGNSRFGGQLEVTNLTIPTNGGFGGGTRAVRIYCTSAAQITITDITVTGGGRGVWINGCNAQVRDSTFGNTGYHFVGGSDSHIYIYTTADNPDLTTTSEGFGGPSNGIIEHLAFLNIVAITWQGGVPFNGDLVNFRDANGDGNIDIDPLNWTPRFAVWWGRYGGQGLFDNRDLRPSVTDGTRQFGCSPSQFYFTETMGPLSITCTDNWGPTMSIAFPKTNGVVNQSTFVANGSVVDLGSGLAGAGWSFDNVTYTPITLPTNGTNWTATLQDIPDDRYYLYTRATDRVGQSYYVTIGPFLVDTSPPQFTLPVPPDYVSGSNFTLEGFAEPQAKMSFTSITGLAGNTTVNGAGEFTLVLPLTEGLNVFTITAVDQAGNRVTKTFSLVVDHTPPALTVNLDPITYTAVQTLVVAGLAEANSTVLVNQIAAPRTAESFEIGVLLAPGTNNIIVSATDGAGNIREWMGIAIYDNTPPDLQVVVSTGETTSTGAHVTKKATVAVGGQVTDALTGVAWLSINGIERTLTEFGDITATVNVTEGLTNFTVVAADLVGNTARFTFSVLRDSTPPTAQVVVDEQNVTIVMVQDVRHTNSPSLTVTVTMSEAGVVTLNSQRHNAAAGANVYLLTLVEGQNNFDFGFTDQAGNVGSSISMTVVRDTTPPAVALTKPTNGQVIVGTSFTVEGSAEIGSTVTINGVPVPLSASGTFSKTLPLENQTASVTVVATDALGNSDDVVLSVTKGTEQVQDQTTEQDLTLPIVFLVVGAVAGVVVGFMVRARGSSAMRRELEEADDGSATGAPGQAPGQGPAHGPAPPPKGPRGPQPPGSM